MVVCIVNTLWLIGSMSVFTLIFKPIHLHNKIYVSLTLFGADFWSFTLQTWSNFTSLINLSYQILRNREIVPWTAAKQYKRLPLVFWTSLHLCTLMTIWYYGWKYMMDEGDEMNEASCKVDPRRSAKSKEA